MHEELKRSVEARPTNDITETRTLPEMNVIVKLRVFHMGVWYEQLGQHDFNGTTLRRRFLETIPEEEFIEPETSTPTKDGSE